MTGTATTRVTGLGGEIKRDARHPGGQSRRMVDADRARLQFGFSAQGRP